MSISAAKPQKLFRIRTLTLSRFEKKLIGATIILLVFNIIDTELTLWGIRLHLIEEGNPFMQLLIEQNPLYLKILKALLPIILGTACWWTRNTSQRLIVYGMGLALIAYSLIMLVHAHWIYTCHYLIIGL